jgi:putative FmdB family regulatory protein
MPIYEYQCRSCGHQLEAFQKISEEPLQECPACHQGELQKLISAAGFQLKGSGWYATDYSSKGKKSSSEEGSASTAKDKTDSSSSGSKDKS